MNREAGGSAARPGAPAKPAAKAAGGAAPAGRPGAPDPVAPASAITGPGANLLRAAPLLLVAAALAVYANAFQAPFVFDDIGGILLNRSLEQIATALNPPAALSVTGRPLVNLSLALNYSISAHEVWSYHAVNVGLHAACALALFGLIRRTLARAGANSGPGLASAATKPPGAFAGEAAAVALGAALLWTVHPLQTAAVTYLMQRSELLMSFCLVLTVDAFARGRYLASVLACACGMASKEAMVGAPVIVLLYDRVFVTGSLTAALRGRPRYYAALGATWVILAALLWGTDGRGGSAGFDAGLAWTDYARTQLYAFGHYVRLIVWPAPLVFDYGSIVVRDAATIAAGAGAVAAALIATLIAFRGRPALGFCGLAFFALLAPTTSIVPIATQTIAEHRLYLALILPLALLVVAARRVGRRFALASVSAAALALSAATLARNRDYASAVALWADTVAKQPANPRAHYNHAVSLLASGATGDTMAALAELETTLQLDPRHAAASQKLGGLLVAAGRAAEALPRLETALRLKPDSAASHHDLALALVRLHRTGEALPHFATAVRLDPSHAAARYNFGAALAELGRYAEALAEFEAASRLDPDDASARRNALQIREYLSGATSP